MSGSAKPSDPHSAVDRAPPVATLAKLAAGILFIALACVIIGYQAKLSLDLARLSGFFGSGDAGVFLGVYAAVDLAVVLLALLLPLRFLAVPIALGGLAFVTAAVAIAIAGGEIWPLLFAVILFAAAWQLGQLVLSTPKLADEGFAGSYLVSLTVGTALIGLLVLIFGVAGLLRWWTIGIAVFGLGLYGLVRLVRVAPSPLRLLDTLASTRLRAAAAGLLGLQASFGLIWAAAPEIQYDAVQYKAWLPAVWASRGGIDFQLFLDHPYTAYLGLLQLVQVPAHLLHAPDAGRFLDFGIAAVIAAWLWHRGDRFGRAVGPLAALIVILTPEILWQATTVYDDLFLGLLALGATAAVLHFEERSPVRPLVASLVIGFLAGTCITGKITTLPFAVALIGLWCVIAGGMGDFWRRLAGGVAGFVAGALPLGLYRWLETGNPIFPYYNGLFDSSDVLSDRSVSSLTGFSGTNVSNLFDFAWRLVSSYSPGIEYAPPGFFGLLVVALVVALLAGWATSSAWRVVWGAAVFAAVAWWIVFRYVRFAIPFSLLFVLLLLPILASLERLLSRRLVSAGVIVGAGIAAAAFFVSTVGLYLVIPERVPISVATGRESDASYESRVLPDAPAVEAFNRVAEPGASLIAQMWGRSLLRPDLDLEWDYRAADRLGLEWGEPVPAADMRSLLAAHGIRWIGLTGNGRLYPENYFLAPLLERHGQVVAADHLHDLYEIVDEPVSPSPVPLCDEELQRPECWVGANPIDTEPGVTAEEVGGLPVEQGAPACPGATYALTVDAGAGRDSVRVFFIFDAPDPEQPFRFVDAEPDRVTVYHQSAPADAKTLTIALQPLGPDTTIDSVRLAVAGSSEADDRCREQLAATGG